MKKIPVFENSVSGSVLLSAIERIGNRTTEINASQDCYTDQISFVHKSYSCSLTGIAIWGWDLL